MQNLEEQQNQNNTTTEKIPHIFLFMWDMYGLEFCQDITKVEKRNMMKALKNEQLERPFNLNALLLRARFNSQRNYEIYTMTVELMKRKLLNGLILILKMLLIKLELVGVDYMENPHKQNPLSNKGNLCRT
jgi:hypothetical protein